MRELGSGPAILWLLPDEDSGLSPLAQRLAADHHVIVLAGSSPEASAVADVTARVKEFVLIGQSNGAADALALARAMPRACTALVLIAPVLEAVGAAAAPPDIPILLLLGTEDARVPPSAAAALCAALPRAHPILVYGAGHAPDRERVDAVAEVVQDFVARRDKFIVRAASDVLFP